ncbi:MAG: nuclear transport factor 2 family protein [Idiomarina sp.]|nr:nuclear transport factor 2 family protein [Idiomarina sp.]
MDSEKLIEKLKDFYAELEIDRLGELDEIYHPEIIFQDPIQQVDGLKPLKSYFEHGLGNSKYCHFAFEQTTVADEHAFLVWQMRLSHEALARGMEIVVPGVSWLKIDKDSKTIRQHKDYYDLGAMVYEHIPLISFFIGKVRDRLEHS